MTFKRVFDAATPSDVRTQIMLQILSQFSVQGDEQMRLVRHCVEDLGCQKMDQYSFENGRFENHNHQLNSTYLSALQSDDQAYLLVPPPPRPLPFPAQAISPPLPPFIQSFDFSKRVIIWLVFKSSQCCLPHAPCA